MEGLISTADHVLPVVVRYVLISAASILVVFGAWFLLSMLWARGSQEGVAIRPFVIVDSTGDLKNGEIGLTRMLHARINDLQKQLDRSIEVLDRARAGDDPAGSASAQVPYSDTQITKGPQARLPGFFYDSSVIKTNPLKLTIQGVDVGSLLSWLAERTAPKVRGVIFTMYIGKEGVAIAGDIGDIGVQDVETIWVPAQGQSMTEAIDELALRLVRLKLEEKNAWMADLSPNDFKVLIDKLKATEDKREAFHSEAVRRKHFAELYHYFAATVRRFDRLPGLVILTAQTARLSGDLDAALRFLRIALNQEEGSKIPRRDEGRLAALKTSIADVEAALAAKTGVALTAAADASSVLPRRLLTSDFTPAAIAILRNVFSALYMTEGSESFTAIASLYTGYAHHGSPLFLPWNRAFLVHLERAGRKRDNRFVLACWDWTEGKVPEIFTAEEAPDGVPNPLFSGPIDNETGKWTTRGKWQGGVALPSKNVIERGLAIPTYPHFRAYVEQQLNNLPHVFVGGDMATFKSAFDPLFYAHRCQVDRIWSIWQIDHPDAKISNDLLDEPLEPFGITVRDVLDTKALGYVY